MALKTRRWQRIENGGLSFTELGFGAAPLGNLYSAISDDEAQGILDQAWEGGGSYYDKA
ncbi:MAG: aldo/keto reductase, partial [Proteobacteria bacterium]|nr:aldo/keto reductase [Pseudomonadota bacterium]